MRRGYSQSRNLIEFTETTDSSLKPIGNPMDMNDIVRGDIFITPTMREVYQAPRGAKWCTIVYSKEEYHCTENEEKNEGKPAFEFKR